MISSYELYVSLCISVMIACGSDVNLNRIHDDVTLWELVYEDRNLMAFLKITGYHWNVDSRDPY